MTREQEISYDITLYAQGTHTIRELRVYIELQLVTLKCEILKDLLKDREGVTMDE